jgi:hypothetical protein
MKTLYAYVVLHRNAIVISHAQKWKGAVSTAPLFKSEQILKAVI